MFLITGFPRSGTRYIATLLNAVGLDVGHEEIRPDGLSSWAHIANGYLSWIGDIEPSSYSPIIHLVRDPLKVISSAQTLRDESFDYMFKHIGHPGGERSLRWIMYAWLKWNGMIEKATNERIKVEEITLQKLSEILTDKPIIKQDGFQEVPKDINTRQGSFRPLSWTDLKRADIKLYKAIREKAKKYGYKIEREEVKKPVEIPKLSAIMIMRNEAHNLRRCLDSIKNVVDEICIVDTGSTDNSIEIAKEYEAKIIERPWQNDFSLHRNQSVSLASGGWLLQIDCDEEFFCKDPVKFKKFLAQCGPEINGIAIGMYDIITGKEPMYFNPVRCFRAGNIRYRGCVHNEPIFEGASPLYPDAHLKHYGYDLTPDQWKVKQKRTIPLLFKRLENNPNDIQAHFFLSQSLSAIENYDEAIEHAQKYIAGREGIKSFQRGVYHTLIQLYLKKDEVQKACKVLDEAAQLYPQDLDIAKIQVEIGNKIKRPDVIVNGAIRYIHSYDAIMKNPALIGNDFVYSKTSESNIFCTFNAMFVMLSDVCTLKKRIEAELCKVSEDFKSKTMEDMEKNFKLFNVTMGGNNGV